MTKDDKKIVRNVILFCIMFSVFFTFYRIITLMDKNKHNSDNVTIEEIYIPLDNQSYNENIFNKQGFNNQLNNNMVLDNSNAGNINKSNVIDSLAELDNNTHVANPYENLDSMLYEAVLKGDFENVRRFIDMGANVNGIDNNGNTIIYRMALQKNLNLDQLNSINYLLIKGANPNKSNYNGYTPLTAHLSSNLFNKDFLDRLIKYNTEINSPDFEGETPLHFAVMNSNIEAVTYLLENGANVNVKNKDGITPLHIAVDKKSYDITAELLHNDADRNTKDINGISALDMAKKSGDVDLYRLFSITQEDLEKDKNNETLLKALEEKAGLPAVSNIAENVAKGFINRPIKQDKGSSSIEGKFVGENPTPLIAALYFNYNEIAKALIKVGADVNKPNDYPYYSPLMVASENNNIEMVKELLANGADINYTSKMDGITALNVTEKADIADLILKAGADANIIANKKCLSPLQLAVINNNYDLAEVLLKYGANANHVDCSEYKPVIANAIDTSNPALVRLLLQYNAGVNTEVGEDLHTKVIDYAKQKGNKLIIDMIEQQLNKTKPKQVDMGIDLDNNTDNNSDNNTVVVTKPNIKADNNTNVEKNMDNKTVNNNIYDNKTIKNNIIKDNNSLKDNKTLNYNNLINDNKTTVIDNKSKNNIIINTDNVSKIDNKTFNKIKPYTDNRTLKIDNKTIPNIKLPIDNKSNEIDDIMNNLVNEL